MIWSHAPPSVLHQFGGFEWIVFMVVFLVILGLIVYLLTRATARTSPRFVPPGQMPPPPPPPATYREKVVVREIVKIACRYCGTLADVAATNCPSCGSPLR